MSAAVHAVCAHVLCWLCCTMQGPTIVVCRDTSGAIFGGFASEDWAAASSSSSSSSSAHRSQLQGKATGTAGGGSSAGSGSFLFSLTVGGPGTRPSFRVYRARYRSAADNLAPSPERGGARGGRYMHL
jgi:hypothetical protein